MRECDINKLIAEKVLGLEVKYDNIVREGRRSGIPQYSRNIDYAWLVVEKLSKKSDFELTKDCDDSFFMCEFAFGLNKVFVGKADTAPAAICKAALSTVGIEIK
ncbi:BC1872 family protein [Niallia circulans]|uniref:Phage ABA sandwich domain-containing protein n=1 Tax=Niallia circulans TaxID=1397 RepID=A0A941GEI7_NIACI|nr:hypothetical protein [Niallia circulans]MCB5235470.1 hypothetical protein [Niallia circulans]